MALAPGTRLGHYEITGSLGAGGMGEVYRAHDARLRRDVALKVLPETFASSPDRLARFEREAQLLASLNHQHIAAVYGLEESPRPDGSGPLRAIVLELVDGPTLADRLVRGPIPIDEALAVARQIAEGLDAAHRLGIVHRDLKPANVKIRTDGVVKVLDFGLAKFAVADSQAPDATASPTLTSPALTHAGVVLGTAAYMSPEQARGHDVDRGADIWAFGCVLFEMLTGVRAFPGAGVADTVAAILRGEPDWALLPEGTPGGVRRLLRRCLQKDRARRLADIRDAWIEIEEAVEVAGAPAGATAARPGRRERLAWGAVVLLLASFVAGVTLWRLPDGGRPAPGTMRLPLATPPSTDLVSLAVSPDGRQVAFVASTPGGQPQLWLQSFETGEARPLRGTDGASYPFWKPDSRSLGYFAGERLYTIDADGGQPTPLAGAPVGAGGAWSSRGTILFAPTPDAAVLRIGDDGGVGTPVPGATARAGQRFPLFLPDGRRFLYYVAESRGVFVADLEGTEPRRLLDADAAATFAPPDTVLFVSDGTLFAQRIDLDRLELVGERTRLGTGIAVDRRASAAAVSASATGTVVFRAGAPDQRRQLLWVDRTGREIATVGAPDTGFPTNVSLAPDGSRAALNRSVDGNTDIWLRELDGAGDIGRELRLTLGAGPEIVPVFSGDGTSLIFARQSSPAPSAPPGFRLFRQPVSGGEGAFLGDVASGGAHIPVDWSRDGRYVLYRALDPERGWDLWSIASDGSGEPRAVAQTPYDERAGQLSDDGRWLAFESDRTGRFEIYVQRFPDGASQRPVSVGGGSQPRWTRADREIVYLGADGRMMAVRVVPPDGEGELEMGAPEPLFAARIEATVQGGVSHNYDVTADGQRFLMSAFLEHSDVPLTVLFGFRAP